MCKRLLAGIAIFVAGSTLSLPLAFVLEMLTGDRTPGAFVSSIVLGSTENCGFLSCLKYGIAIGVGTDAVFVFTLLSISYIAFNRLRRPTIEKQKAQGESEMRNRHHTMLAVAAFAFMPLSSTHAQQPLLQIVSPADQIQVAHGQTITIDVQADSSVQNVFVMAESPLPNVTRSLVANQFYLTIPDKISPRLFTITAMGQDPNGELVVSAPITLDIERPDNPFVLFDSNGLVAQVRLFVPQVRVLLWAPTWVYHLR